MTTKAVLGHQHGLLHGCNAMTDDERRAIDLESVLRRIVVAPSGKLLAKEFKQALTAAEYDEYRADLRANREYRKSDRTPPLSPEAQAYWDAFQALCLSVNLANSRERRNRLVDEAAELMEQFEAMPRSDKGRFRTLNPSQGNTQWARALHELEHDLPFLDEDGSAAGFLDNVEGFTQQQFLRTLIDRLREPKTQTAMPKPLLWHSRNSSILALAKRLSR